MNHMRKWQSFQGRTLLKHYVVSSNLYINNLMGYKPEKTQYFEIPSNSWGRVIRGLGLDASSSGVFLPRSQTALIQENNHFGQIRS